MELEEGGEKKEKTLSGHTAMVCTCAVITDQQKLVSGGARGPPAYSGSRRTGSAGPRPCEARTRQRSCCLPHLQRRRRCGNENPFSCANRGISLETCY